MSGHWEPSVGASDEWYTPRYIFDALGERFDLDVAAPADLTHVTVPASTFIHADSLQARWFGFVWMNPPFGGRNALKPWLDKFFNHGNGIALTPDRTSAPWWQDAARRADCLLHLAGKVRFIRPDGTQGVAPSNGTTLFASGRRAQVALSNAGAAGLGWCGVRVCVMCNGSGKSFTYVHGEPDAVGNREVLARVEADYPCRACRGVVA